MAAQDHLRFHLELVANVGQQGGGFSELLATLELANSPAGLVSLFNKIQYRLKRLSVALSPWDYRECVAFRPIAPKDKNKRVCPLVLDTTS